MIHSKTWTGSGLKTRRHLTVTFQYTAIDKYSRYRILGAYPEQTTYSSYLFLLRVVDEFKRKGIKVECVKTDNGFEFTNRLAYNEAKHLSKFEEALSLLNIRHKKIRLYTPRLMARSKEATEKTRSDSMIPTPSTPSPTLVNS